MNSKCPHNRRKSICKECKGSRLCIHNLQKNSCVECNINIYFV